MVHARAAVCDIRQCAEVVVIAEPGDPIVDHKIASIRSGNCMTVNGPHQSFFFPPLIITGQEIAAEAAELYHRPQGTQQEDSSLQ